MAVPEETPTELEFELPRLVGVTSANEVIAGVVVIIVSVEISVLKLLEIEGAVTFPKDALRITEELRTVTELENKLPVMNEDGDIGNEEFSAAEGLVTGIELAVVLDELTVDKEEVGSPMLGDKDPFALGVIVLNTIEGLRLKTLLGSALDELDDGVELKIGFKLSEDIIVGSRPDVNVVEEVADELATVLEELRTEVGKLKLPEKVLARLSNPVLDGSIDGDEVGVMLKIADEGVKPNDVRRPVGASIELFSREIVELRDTLGTGNELLEFAEDDMREDPIVEEGIAGGEPLELVSREDNEGRTPFDIVGKLELAASEGVELGNEPEIGTNIDETNVMVVVNPESLRVSVMVTAVDTLDTDGVPDPAVGFGNEIVEPPLVGAEKLGENMGDPVKEDKLGAMNDGTMVVSAVEMTVVGCPFESVVVAVIKTLEMVGIAGLEDTPDGEGNSVVIEPPGRVLINVVKTLEMLGRPAPDVDSGGTPPSTFVDDVLMVMVSDPPGIVLVSMIGMPKAVVVAEPEGTAEGSPLSAVVEVLVSMVVGIPESVLVNIVVDPPGIMLVIVINTLEIVPDPGASGRLGDTTGKAPVIEDEERAAALLRLPGSPGMADNVLAPVLDGTVGKPGVRRG
ncbi:hypothetical protein EJ02DRAFT_419332 [Clathrospora elynae]|uniref:Uncharacterized protein n=1 Tax=Clathrospora elynae TaxID=706981 RepID=A0A6A5T1V4_9PLEO|nr:hypothetical protein EJ02DRAFT_419332 [Clathrospora elynae]